MESGVLIQKTKGAEEKQYIVSGAFSIGRHPENQLQILDPNISRFHTIIEPKEGGICIRDLGSKNGTRVNGNAIVSHCLKEGDLVQIGDHHFLFCRSFTIDGPEGERFGPFYDLPTVDLHCHIIPGLDDGARDFSMALDMCREAQRDGIEIIVATAHTLDGMYNNSKKTILQALKTLRKETKRFGIEICLLPGAEVRASPNLLDLIESDEVLTLNDQKRFMFVEFPQLFASHLILKFLDGLIQMDISPVICHPERTSCLADINLLEDIVELGGLMQITSGSLTNLFGQQARRFSIKALERGLVHFLASDSHSPKGRPPKLSEGLNEAQKIIGREKALRLVKSNPCSLLLKGMPINYTDTSGLEAQQTANQPLPVNVNSSKTRPSTLLTPVVLSPRGQAEKRAGKNISVFSNTGGVGKTHLAINLACALSNAGCKVLLVDLDLGNGDIANKLSITPPFDLFDYLNRDRLFSEVVFEYDTKFHVIFSRGGEVRLANLNYMQKRRFINDFKKIYNFYDFIIFDLGAGISNNVLDFTIGADIRIIMTTPVDILSAYNCIKAIFHRNLAINKKDKNEEGFISKKDFHLFYLVMNKTKGQEEGYTYFNKLKELIDMQLYTSNPSPMIRLEFLGLLEFNSRAFHISEKNSVPIFIQNPNSRLSKQFITICKKILEIHRFGSSVDIQENLFIKFRNFLGI